ncbi:hypothetical protein [Marinobacterium rhizophilum]|uniref:Uncharacterized protein n=1 Tax=Marinobacterium rhizophilum TaxID=420402 RepID=A0ABY5HLG4_9GAMM|nr:hypothetical protein [Marinobacterium rhizophilum]UTW12092.1 hypothetical protein KDW95_23235 [Marinobacterium rhizophilum]
MKEILRTLKAWQTLIAAIVAVVGIPIGTYSALIAHDSERNRQLFETRISLVTAIRWEIYGITHKAEDFLAAYKEEIKGSLLGENVDEEEDSSITPSKFIFWKNLQKPKVFDNNLDKLGILESGVVARIMTFYTGLENMNLFMESLSYKVGDGTLTKGNSKTLLGIMSMLCESGTDAGENLDSYLKHYGVETPRATHVYDCKKPTK